MRCAYWDNIKCLDLFTLIKCFLHIPAYPPIEAKMVGNGDDDGDPVIVMVVMLVMFVL